LLIWLNTSMSLFTLLRSQVILTTTCSSLFGLELNMLMQNLNNFYHQLFNLIMQIFYFERSNQKFRPLLRLSRIQENMFVIDHKFKKPMALYTEMPHESCDQSHDSEIKWRHTEMRFLFWCYNWLRMLFGISLNTVLRQYITQCHYTVAWN
jgi:hypothetical protein